MVDDTGNGQSIIVAASLHRLLLLVTQFEAVDSEVVRIVLATYPYFTNGLALMLEFDAFLSRKQHERVDLRVKDLLTCWLRDNSWEISVNLQLRQKIDDVITQFMAPANPQWASQLRELLKACPSNVMRSWLNYKEAKTKSSSYENSGGFGQKKTPMGDKKSKGRGFAVHRSPASKPARQITTPSQAEVLSPRANSPSQAEVLTPRNNLEHDGSAFAKFQSLSRSNRRAALIGQRMDTDRKSVV